MCARRTARSFGSSTEIVSSASLQSRRSERGRRGVVGQGCWTSSVRKASRLSSWAMDRSMTTGDPFDMAGREREGGRWAVNLSSRAPSWQVLSVLRPICLFRTGAGGHEYCMVTPLTALAGSLSPRCPFRTAAPVAGTRGCAGPRRSLPRSSSSRRRSSPRCSS